MKKNHSYLFALMCVTIFLLSCEDGPNLAGLTGNAIGYTLNSKSDPNISGIVTFAERADHSTSIIIQLSGVTSGNHPAHIHANTALEGGGIVLDLSDVGIYGTSTTEVTALNDGTPVTYDDLVNFDGYINVHLSESDLATLIAQGDIGQNGLTGNSEEYALFSVSDPNISGTVTFEERTNQETLITVQLAGTSDGDLNPSHIHANTAAMGGGIVIDLNDVDGSTGMAVTNVSVKNDGTPITYNELIEFNGYVNVHLSSTNLGTLVAQGDIGQNEFTGNSEVYDLGPKSDPNISGTATFKERANGFTLIIIQLAGTTAGGDHPAHIHNNSAAQGGGIAIDLTNINGDTGLSKTEITMMNDNTEITYSQLITFNGYINVHLSASNLGTLIAQGDIGSNAN